MHDYIYSHDIVVFLSKIGDHLQCRLFLKDLNSVCSSHIRNIYEWVPIGYSVLLRGERNDIKIVFNKKSFSLLFFFFCFSGTVKLVSNIGHKSGRCNVNGLGHCSGLIKGYFGYFFSAGQWSKSSMINCINYFSQINAKENHGYTAFLRWSFLFWSWFVWIGLRA